MRKMKKLASLMLALVMVFSMAMTVTAAKGTNTDDGKITIDNAVKGQTYTIYEILKLESYDTDKNAYSYKATDDWVTFINREDIKGTYVEVDAQGYVTWKTDASASKFAALAKTYAKSLSSNQGQAEATSGTVEFTNLNLGYYLVDSTLGTVCSLDTTNPTVVIKEKNGKPTVDKKVQENSNKEWGAKNDASIGDTVNYETTINAVDGDPTNYVLHDKMSEGLTFDPSSVKVTVNGENAETGWTLKTEDLTDGCTFEISFADVNPNDVIVVTYSAVLNEKAVISTDANTNETWLNYGNDNDQETEKAHTDTYAYKFDLVKTDSSDKVLAGAEFKLYDAQTGGNEITLVKESEGVYRVDASGTATIEAGQVTIKGLDSGTYWLEETKAPEGFNKLAERVKVEIKGANLDATVTGNTWTAGGVHVVNNTGTELPSTGGMGTTVFYVLGSILVIGAAVLLITRRRMSK